MASLHQSLFTWASGYFLYQFLHTLMEPFSTLIVVKEKKNQTQTTQVGKLKEMLALSGHHPCPPNPLLFFWVFFAVVIVALVIWLFVCFETGSYSLCSPGWFRLTLPALPSKCWEAECVCISLLLFSNILCGK